MINLNNLLNYIEKSLNHEEKHFFTKKYSTFFLVKILFVLKYSKNRYFLNLDLKSLEKYFDIINYLVSIDMSMHNNDNYYIVNTMLNFNQDEIAFSLNCNKDYLYNYVCGYKLLKNKDNVTNVDDIEKYYLAKKNSYLKLLKNKDINSIDNIINEIGIDKFKEIYFYFVYGLELYQVEYITNTFHKYIDSLKEDLNNNDRFIYNILLDINNIASNNFDNISYSHFRQSLLKQDINYTNFYNLTLKIKIMYMNAYNKRFTKINDCKRVKIFPDVDTYLAPDDFFLALHSTEKSNSYSDSLDDFETDDFTYLENSKSGISTSIVGPSNTGLLLSSFYLGFDNFSPDTLETLAPFDAFTSNRSISLFSDYLSLSSDNYFIPPAKIEDETRYGYNEMFNYTNKKPTYIVYLSDADNLSYSINIKKAAQILNVPIIILNIYKIHLKEILKIKKMEDLLFKENNLSLISDIICKYMNLVSGSIVSSNDFDPMKPTYSGIKELNNFLVRFNEAVDSMNDKELKKNYLIELKKAYDLELEKYKIAIKIKSYQKLLSTFVLDDKKYVDMKNYLINKYNEIGLESTFSLK